MFYRVKGPSGEVSPIEKVNFVRLWKPVIVKPMANQRLQTAPGTNAAVEVEIKKPQGASVWYQVATDREFTRVVANQNTLMSVACASYPLASIIYVLAPISETAA